jgi:hypothetical protein
VSYVRIKKPSGILPEKLLKENVKEYSFLRFPSEDGI